MTQIIFIILGVVIVALLLRQKTRTLLRARLRTGKEQIVGICAAAMGLDAKKRENKEKILELLKENPSTRHQPSTSSGGTGQTSSGNKGLSNSEIREALGISERSAVRYMDELEREGKVEQVGNTGRSVAYRLR